MMIFSGFSHKKMIFHSYVSLPEGTSFIPIDFIVLVNVHVVAPYLLENVHHSMKISLWLSANDGQLGQAFANGLTCQVD